MDEGEQARVVFCGRPTEVASLVSWLGRRRLLVPVRKLLVLSFDCTPPVVYPFDVFGLVLCMGSSSKHSPSSRARQEEDIHYHVRNMDEQVVPSRKFPAAMTAGYVSARQTTRKAENAPFLTISPAVGRP